MKTRGSSAYGADSAKIVLAAEKKVFCLQLKLKFAVSIVCRSINYDRVLTLRASNKFDIKALNIWGRLNDTPIQTSAPLF